MEYQPKETAEVLPVVQRLSYMVQIQSELGPDESRQRWMFLAASRYKSGHTGYLELTWQYSHFSSVVGGMQCIFMKFCLGC